MTSLIRQDTGVLRSDPVIREAHTAALAEVAAVGRALDVNLADDIEQRCLDWLDQNAPIKPSLLVDLEAGKRLEVGWLSGAVHRLGKKAGVPTPTHTAIYAALRPFESGPKMIRYSG